MNPPLNAPYRVVEMERTRGQGSGEVILFGLITPSTPAPAPIFCLCYRKTGWEFLMDSHYNPEVISRVANNGAKMGLRDLIQLAKTYAVATYPNG